MHYTEYPPHPALAPFIDAYWTATGDADAVKTEKILPDGCIDIIFNLGPDCYAESNTFVMNSSRAYLIGTMTRFKETIMQPETRLLGIRFKPAAFMLFYEYSSLERLTDTTVEFDKELAPDFNTTLRYSIQYLDHFFLKKLSKPGRTVLPIIEGIREAKGLLTVKTLAEKHFTTTRQLERAFNRQLGISPKEFINLVRYQTTFQQIKNNSTQKSLLQIAFECGYYDHSHLTNEMKRYTGTAPAQW